MSAADRERVIVVGAGFAGLEVARGLPERFDVTVVDRTNHHLFQPLLYQVVVGAISPGEIAVPVRTLLRARRNVRVLEATVTDVDPGARTVTCTDGAGETVVLPWDRLILAPGTEPHWFGNDDWAEHAPALKDVPGALHLRAAVLGALETAETAAARGADAETLRRALSIVVVGAGPTGVELAGAIAELSRHALPGEFRHVDPAQLRVELIEGVDAVLPGFPDRLQRHARSGLEALGVIVRTGVMVSEVDDGGVTVSTDDEDGGRERHPAALVCWAAGVKPVPLVARLAERLDIEPAGGGRLAVDHRLALPDHPSIHLLGDVAAFEDPRHGTLPGVAAVAKQQGRWLARHLAGRTRRPFRYRDWGAMAVVGRFDVVASILGLRLTGRSAWVLWALMHIAWLTGFDRKLRVLVSWGWRFARNRYPARLVTRD
jgi:NADH dehydrogenase